MAQKERIVNPLDYGDLQGGLVRMMNRFHAEGTLTGDPEADEYLREDANAALLGLLYDQRVRAEYAFTGPHRLRERLGHLDVNVIAAMDAEGLRATFAERPAVHRFTNKMADTTHALAVVLSEQYAGNAANIWNDGVDLATVEERVRRLPGFGAMKAAKIRYVLHYFGHRDCTD